MRLRNVWRTPSLACRRAKEVAMRLRSSSCFQRLLPLHWGTMLEFRRWLICIGFMSGVRENQRSRLQLGPGSLRQLETWIALRGLARQRQDDGEVMAPTWL